MAARLAREFMNLLKHEQFATAMSKAGERVKKASALWDRLDALNMAAEEAASAEQRASINKECADVTAEFDEAHFYEVFGGRPDQQECIKALDYDDRIIPGVFNLFYCCRAKICDEHCGLYFPGKFWEVGFRNIISS
jgi:hypothetical protein